ncbi:ATP-dependent zinc protease [Shewanella sp.]|uniref:ATP-dependent zinc protease family protein n=1 Tax=Shewanella sp. TaxID=50422 RepID=UPI001ECDD2F2|nr:ATP-dependent zinc protease [Shewanella sp.]NRB23949.1 ATP-dependent zinc protease [Shewanella sp.]
MLKQMFCIAAITTLAGCASTNQIKKLPQPIDAAALETSLAKQQTDLVAVIDENTQAQAASYALLSTQLIALETQIAQLKLDPKETKAPIALECPPSPLGDKFLLGATENVYVDEIKASFKTRIDTGAESSSLDARNIILFERDGKQWVRFDVLTQGSDAPAETFESRVERFVRIKQESAEKSDRRPVIHAHLQIGKYKAETDLNLVDRSHLDFPLLLGRKFMQDIAIVDVGQTFIHGKKLPHSAVNR